MRKKIEKQVDDLFDGPHRLRWKFEDDLEELLEKRRERLKQKRKS